MPKGDRTGPMGAGAKSGRAAGYCRGFDNPGYANTTIPGGLGMGMGRRRGGWAGPMPGSRGWRNKGFAAGRPDNMYYEGHPASSPPYHPEFEKESLRNRCQALQSELNAIGQRLEEIESQEKAP